MNVFRKHSRAHRHPHQVEVRLESLQQFFNSMDPSPFYERDLDPDAEHFIVSWIEEFPLRDPVRLVLHLPSNGASTALQTQVEEAVHNHFRNQTRLARLEFRHLMRIGSRSLVIGLAVLTTCLLGVELMGKDQGQVAVVARQSLLIGGWVAMWQPMQTYLYGWWPLLRRRRVFEKLSRIPVKISTASHPPEARPASSP